MKKLLDSPEIVAAIFTVIGTLLVSVILGFLEGRIGFESLIALVAIILLGVLLFSLYRRAGLKITVGAAAVMVVIGFVIFFISRGIRQRAVATPADAVAISSPGGIDASTNSGISETPTLDQTQVQQTATVSDSEPTATPAGNDALADTTTISLPPVGTWQPISDLPEKIISIAVNPDNPQRLYSGATGFLYRSEDAGVTWASVSTGLPDEDITALAHTGAEPGILYATLGPKNHIFSSSDEGVNWTQMGTLPVPAGGFVKKLYIASANPERLYFISEGHHIAYSPNEGSSWFHVGEGLPGYEEGRTTILTLAIHPIDANILYAGTGGFVGQGHGVYKSVDAGQNWIPTNRGMFDLRVTALAVDPADPQILYAGGDSGDLFKSMDGGENWTKLTETLKVQAYSAPRQIQAIGIDSQDSTRLCLLGDNSGLMFSGDGGQQWQMLGKPGEDTQPYFSVATMIMTPQIIVIADRDQESAWRYAQIME